VRRPAGAPVAETALATTAAGLAALQVLTHLDGVVRPDAVGRTLEVSLPHGAVRRRSWSPHAGCGCNRFDVADAPTSEPHDQRRHAEPAR